jgi:hypothetical protein
MESLRSLTPLTGGEEAEGEGVMGVGLGLGVRQLQAGSDMAQGMLPPPLPPVLQAGSTMAQNMLPPPPVLQPTLGSLHKRRVQTSPEKFNSGKFEPLPLRIEPSTTTITSSRNGAPSAKRARLENKIEITYDSLGTPRIASITPTWALPSGKQIPLTATYNRASKSVLSCFLRHNDLLLLLVSYLPFPALIALYSISKPFHAIFNRHYTAFVVSNIRTWAPNADRIFPWRCYQSLCIKDPILRQKSSMMGKDVMKRGQDLRDVPSLKWLQMVIWRQGVCKDMLIQLATEALRCPKGTLDAVRRMWFLMDLPLNAHRIALCRCQEYITNRTIYLATLFFLKVDMAFTDPVGAVFPGPGVHTNVFAYPRRWENKGFTGVSLRETLLAERGFTPLWRVLHGWSPDITEPAWPMNRLDVLKLYARHHFTLPPEAPEETKKMSVMGIPWYEVGTAGLERTGVSIYQLGEGKIATRTHPFSFAAAPPDMQKPLYPHKKFLLLPTEKTRDPLLRPDEIMLKEGIRRRLGLHKHWAKMMLWGFCDDLGRNLPVRSEQELLDWSNGKPPLHPLLKDEEYLEKKKAKEEKLARETEGWEDMSEEQREEMVTRGLGWEGGASGGMDGVDGKGGGLQEGVILQGEKPGDWEKHPMSKIFDQRPAAPRLVWKGGKMPDGVPPPPPVPGFPPPPPPQNGEGGGLPPPAGGDLTADGQAIAGAPALPSTAALPATAAGPSTAGGQALSGAPPPTGAGAAPPQPQPAQTTTMETTSTAEPTTTTTG